MTRLIYQGILIGVLITILADGAHWFITPPAFDASAGRRVAVVIQMIVALVAAVAVWRKAKRDAVLLEVQIVSSHRDKHEH